MLLCFFVLLLLKLTIFFFMGAEIHHFRSQVFCELLLLNICGADQGELIPLLLFSFVSQPGKSVLMYETNFSSFS